MPSHADHHAAIGPVDFSTAEMNYLLAWGRLRGFEVGIEPAGAEYADEVASVGYRDRVASWTIYRAHGNLWLDFIADQPMQEPGGWKVSVRSIMEATARIESDAAASGRRRQ